MTVELSGTGPDVTYTPDPDWHGPDGFSFRVVDSAGAPSAPVSVALDVASTNDLPAAAPLEVAMTETIEAPIA